MALLRKAIFGIGAAAAVLVAWTAMMAAVTFSIAPGTSVAIFAAPGSALAAAVAAEGGLVDVGRVIVVARFDDPGFVRRLYAEGAILVLDARMAGGCTGLPPKSRVALQS
jgi:hypothetical protein